MDDVKLRAWWWHCQGLDGTLRGASPAAILEQSGWARSVGGVGPYLSLFARGGTSREEADRAVAALEIHELPSARGCAYVLPARDFALGLAVGQTFSEGERRTAAKLGVTDQEIEQLCAAVLDAVDGAPLSPEEIRDATGKAARNLGEEGKKRGLMTTLPVALGELQARGEIRRVPIGGRLDQQRYKYVRWKDNGLVGRPLSNPESFTELARRFFGWVGPATLKEFQWFSGLGAKAARDATVPLDLVPIEAGHDRMLLRDQLVAFQQFTAPAKPVYALVSSLDAIAAARRDLVSLLDPVDQHHVALSDPRQVAGGTLSDLPSHAILDRGRLIGLWEFDPDANELVWATFDGKRPKPLRDAVEETAVFVRDQLGDARSFSLDSPKSRTPRIAALRRMA